MAGYIVPHFTTRSWQKYEADLAAAKGGRDLRPRVEEALNEPVESVAAFHSPGRRLVYLAGGVLMNVVAAVLCMWVFLRLSVPPTADPQKFTLAVDLKCAAQMTVYAGGRFLVMIPGLLRDQFTPPSEEEATSIRRDLGANPYRLLVILWAFNLFGAVFNLLPFPPLDGGRMVCTGYELIARACPPQRLVGALEGVGVAVFMVYGVLILVLMVRDMASSILR